MTATVWPVDAVAGAPEYSGKLARQAMGANLYGATSTRPLGAHSGVKIGTPTDTVSVSGSTVTIKPHAGILDVQASASAGPYWYAFDANETKTLDAAHATFARIDIITVKLDDPAESDGSSVPAVSIVYKAGTAAGSPTTPTPTTTREMVIATITVPASGGGSAVVSWTAPYAAASGGWVPVRTTTERDALAAAVAPTTHYPLRVYRADATAGKRWEYTDDAVTWYVQDSRDTGWMNLTVGGGWTAGAACQYRRIGDVVYLRGELYGGSAGTSPFTLPVLPVVRTKFIIPRASGGANTDTAGIFLDASTGVATIVAHNGSIAGSSPGYNLLGLSYLAA